ncbi:MAG: hypothetical protein JWM58_3096 [Rhizobium sp.]|nr:hypothetical protein [Rhizobium sp.]
MTAYTVVRFRPKEGRHEEFQTLFCNIVREFEGLRHFALAKSASGDYFSIGEWDTFEHIVAARPKMLGNLDSFRHTLAEFGQDLGVTDAISGEAILDLTYDGKVP